MTTDEIRRIPNIIKKIAAKQENIPAKSVVDFFGSSKRYLAAKREKPTPYASSTLMRFENKPSINNNNMKRYLNI